MQPCTMSKDGYGSSVNAMVSDQTRNAVWQEILDVARLVRYYEALADRHRFRHSMIRFLLLAAAAGGIAALLELLPPVAQLVAGGLVALLVVWDFISNYAKKAAVLHAISLECSYLENEWRELWLDINNGTTDEDDARNRNNRLARRIADVTGWAGHADIRENRKLNEKCEEAAYRVVVDQYAT